MSIRGGSALSNLIRNQGSLIKSLEKLRDELAEENDKLRGLLSKSDKDCPYCGLTSADIAKCARGFPGCARMDDIVNSIESKEVMQLKDRILELENIIYHERHKTEG